MQEIATGIYAKIDGGDNDPTILLLHGVSVTHTYWGQEFIDALVAAGYRVVQPDLPGFGRSPLINGLVHNTASILSTYLKTLSEPSVLIGHSYGGGVASLITYQHPELVSKLVLIAPGGIYPSPMKTLVKHEAEIGYVGSTIIRNMVAVLRENERLSKLLPEHDFEWDQTNMPAAIRSLTHCRLDRIVNEIKTPTFLIYGQRDRVIFPFLMRRLARKTRWKTLMIPNCGHLPMVEEPRRLSRAITNWLARTRP